MSLNFGRTILAIPGPSVIPDRVLNAMHRASPNIYEGELIDLTASLFPDLKTVAQTKHHAAIYIGNGHAAWEAALQNTLNTGDEILVLSTGRFAAGWGEMARGLGIETQVLDFGMQGQIEPDTLEATLHADKNKKIKAIICVQTDTASSVKNDVAALRTAIDQSGHDALFMVDCIASLGCDRFEMDTWGVDVMVAGCQKGLMTPAGISFVYFNDKAATARKTASPSLYWDWHPRANPDVFYQQFAGTAPTHHLYGLRKALDILVHEEGIKNAWARHEALAHTVWAALDVWEQGGVLKHNIEDVGNRTTAVSALNTTGDESTAIRKWCEANTGVTLGISLGFAEPHTAEWDKHFRIGHMGHLNLHMIMGTLGAIDTALKALNIPHGENALNAAAQELARRIGS